MTENLTQVQVFSLIAQLNSFADQAEKLIQQTNRANTQAQQSLDNRHKQALDQLKRNYENACRDIVSHGDSTIREAREILTDVQAMDARLANTDKYYKKTKEKKEEELSGVISDRFGSSTDYFFIMDEIRHSYQMISERYARDMLPGIINGLNYLFSKKRKQDYEDLIVLLNTLYAFVQEMESFLPDIISDSLKQQKNAYNAQLRSMKVSQVREQEALSQNSNDSLTRVAQRIWDEMDNVLPDALVNVLTGWVATYQENLLKVNSGAEIQNGTLFLAYVDYPVDFFVESPLVGSVILEKCAPLAKGKSVRFPIAMTVNDAPPMLLTGSSDISNVAEISGPQEFAYALMFGFLSSCPVARITFTVMDPEHRGNSIYAFFEAKKKLPELFGEKIHIKQEDISEKINSLNEKIEDVLQTQLGTKYDTVFDYAADTPSFEASPELLLIYDFPNGFDDQSIAGLRNILRNGSRCGVYVLMLTEPPKPGERADDYQKKLKAIDGLYVPLAFSADSGISMRGMPLIYDTMPQKAVFNQFFGKYMLLFEGIQNRGIAFSPLIKKLVDIQDKDEMESHIRLIGDLLEQFDARYGMVLDADVTFPDSVTLGHVLYPAEIFNESPYFQRLVQVFGESDGGKQCLDLPLNLDLAGNFNLIVESSKQCAEQVCHLTHHVIWSLLSFLPATKVNFSVIDVENSNSIALFSELKKDIPDLFNVVTQKEQVSELFRSLNRQIDSVLDKLGSRHKNVLEYNLAAPRRSEPITLLVLYDFPSGLEGRTMDELESILRRGNRCGIYTILCHNPEVKFSRYDNLEERLEEIGKYCIAMEYRDKSFRMLPFGLPLRIPKPLDRTQEEKFRCKYKEVTEEVKNQGISFTDIVPEEKFQASSIERLSIPIGIGDGESVVNLVFGEGTSHHCLIGGGTGGGKSTLLHTVIMSCMLNYAPDQLNLYLMDFKGGTEFKIYESVRLPHIKLLAIDALQEFGESILESLVKEMENRSGQFKSSGFSSLRSYVEGTGKPMPRILVIMDEFQILFNDQTNRKVAMNCANQAKRIVTEGRSYGVHLMMATQSMNILSTLTLDRGTIDQMRVRIGLKCGDDARYMFSDLYSEDAKSKMQGPRGTAVLNEDFTETPESGGSTLQLGNIGLRVAYCTDALKETYLKIISAACADAPCSTQVFEGARVTPLADGLMRMINNSFVQKLPISILMGDKIKVEPDSTPAFGLQLDRKKKHNLLLCGTDTYMTENILRNYIISAACNVHTEIYCMDGSTLVDEPGLESYVQIIMGRSAFQNRIHFAESRADMIRTLHDVYEEFLRRKKGNAQDAIVVVIHNLQYLDIFQNMLKNERVAESEYLDEATEEDNRCKEETGQALEDSNSSGSAEEEPFDPANPFASFFDFIASRDAAKTESVPEPVSKSTLATAEGYSNEKLLRLINDGSGYGIHFVITCSDYQTVQESMRFGEKPLSKFTERMVYAMNDNDAMNLVDNVSVAHLASNLVYYTDGVKAPFQLKPYIAPTEEELPSILQAFETACQEGC